MFLRMLVMAGAAALVLAYIWWRNRRASARTPDAQNRAGRGLVDEAAMAVEDVAAEFIGRDGKAFHSRHAGSTAPRERDVPPA